MPYMGKTEVIPLLPNGSWPCELSPVTKSTQAEAAVLTNTKRALSKKGPCSSCLEQAPVWENNTRENWLQLEELKTQAVGSCRWLLKAYPTPPKKWPTLQKEWESQKQWYSPVPLMDSRTEQS